MMDELQQLLNLVKELPELTIWVLAGFGLYKLIMYLSATGSVVFILKLLIERLYQAHANRMEKGGKPRDVDMSGHFITSDGTYKRFLSLIDCMKDSTYLHKYHVDYLIDAVAEKQAKGDKIKYYRRNEDSSS